MIVLARACQGPTALPVGVIGAGLSLPCGALCQLKRTIWLKEHDGRLAVQAILELNPSRGRGRYVGLLGLARSQKLKVENLDTGDHRLDPTSIDDSVVGLDVDLRRRRENKKILCGGKELNIKKKSGGNPLCWSTGARTRSCWISRRPNHM